MIFGVAELITYISKHVTLEAGDVIATGAPPGVAMGQPTPRYLRHGDTVEIDIESVGTLRNRVVVEATDG